MKDQILWIVYGFLLWNNWRFFDFWLTNRDLTTERFGSDAIIFSLFLFSGEMSHTLTTRSFPPLTHKFCCTQNELENDWITSTEFDMKVVDWSVFYIEINGENIIIVSIQNELFLFRENTPHTYWTKSTKELWLWTFSYRLLFTTHNDNKRVKVRRRRWVSKCSNVQVYMKHKSFYTHHLKHSQSYSIHFHEIYFWFYWVLISD
jgi:hypothetical protein